MSDIQRRKIFARRAHFIAAAVAGLTTACDRSESTPPQIAADDARPRVAEDASPPHPIPCLTVAMPQPSGPPPHPCLSIAPKPHPAKGDAKDPCDPPYTIDATGLKHFKPQCL